MQTTSNGGEPSEVSLSAAPKISFKGFKISAQLKKDAPVVNKPSTFASSKDDEDSESRKRSVICFENGKAKV